MSDRARHNHERVLLSAYLERQATDLLDTVELIEADAPAAAKVLREAAQVISDAGERVRGLALPAQSHVVTVHDGEPPPA